jgi:xanthine dehydrogenase accessory factor
MNSRALQEFLSAHPTAICAELTEVRGSSPRDAGTFMLIAAGATLGTIGGGMLEYMVIDRARQVLRDGVPENMDIPLGPEIGQCCGGRVQISLRLVETALAARLQALVDAEIAARPHVFVFGAGHVGRALAEALALLPVQAHVIDTRADVLEGLPETIEAKAVALPEAVVRGAPNGSSYVVLTHDHALDFLIAAEALKRDDAPYVGMVGSASKRARFASWYRSEGGDAAALARLVLPIGGTAFAGGLGDKRPEVIAALAAAEILVQIGRGHGAAERRERGRAMTSEAVDGG